MNITEKHAKKLLEVVDAGLTSGIGNPKPGEMCVEAAVCYALGLPHGDDPECVSHAVRQLKITLNDKQWSSNAARAKGLRRLALIQLGSRDKINDNEFVGQIAEMTIRKVVPYALWCAAKIQKDSKLRQALLDAAERCEREGTRATAAANAAAYAAYAANAAAAANANAATAAANAAYAAAAAAAANAAATAAANAAYAAATAAANAAYAAAYAAAAAAAANAAYAAANAHPEKNRDKILSKFAEEVVQILIGLKAPGAKWLYLTEGWHESL